MDVLLVTAIFPVSFGLAYFIQKAVLTALFRHLGH